jgi:hypothetical protein
MEKAMQAIQSIIVVILIITEVRPAKRFIFSLSFSSENSEVEEEL